MKSLLRVASAFAALLVSVMGALLLLGSPSAAADTPPVDGCYIVGTENGEVILGVDGDPTEFVAYGIWRNGVFIGGQINSPVVYAPLVSGINHFSISTAVFPDTQQADGRVYCGSVSGSEGPTIATCSVSLVSPESGLAWIDYTSTSAGTFDVHVWRDGRYRKTFSSNSPREIVLLGENVNFVSIGATAAGAAPDRSTAVYCGKVTNEGPSRIPGLATCTLTDLSGTAVRLDVSRVDGGENRVAYHIWRNGRVIKTFVREAVNFDQAQELGPVVQRVNQLSGRTFFSVSTGRVGEAPDPDRRVNCGNVTL